MSEVELELLQKTVLKGSLEETTSLLDKLEKEVSPLHYNIRWGIKQMHLKQT